MKLTILRVMAYTYSIDNDLSHLPLVTKRSTSHWPLQEWHHHKDWSMEHKHIAQKTKRRVSYFAFSFVLFAFRVRSQNRDGLMQWMAITIFFRGIDVTFRINIGKETLFCYSWQRCRNLNQFIEILSRLKSIGLRTTNLEEIASIAWPIETADILKNRLGRFFISW